MSKITSEELRKIAAQKQHGLFEHEENANYDRDMTKPNIVRFSPYPRDMPDGTQSMGFSFPALVATGWLKDAPTVMASVADQMNAAPDLAAELLALREAHERQQKVTGKLVETLKPFAYVANLLEEETEGVADSDEMDLMLGEYLAHRFIVSKFKEAHAALTEWEARNG